MCTNLKGKKKQNQRSDKDPSEYCSRTPLQLSIVAGRISPFHQCDQFPVGPHPVFTYETPLPVPIPIPLLPSPQVTQGLKLNLIN